MKHWDNETMERNEVTVTALDKRYKKLEKDLAAKTQKVLLFLRQSGVGVEVYLTGSPKMRQLNRQYRGRDEATGVLSFGAPEDFPKTSPNFLGEVYLCPSYIGRHHKDIQALLAHGILHLLGFNHARLSDRITMGKVEEAVAAFIRERSERV